MSAYAVVHCDAKTSDKRGCPNRVEVSVTPDRLVAYIRELRRAGWSRTKRGDFCPAHPATTSG